MFCPLQRILPFKNILLDHEFKSKVIGGEDIAYWNSAESQVRWVLVVFEKYVF